jgi:hypothetical protein
LLYTVGAAATIGAMGIWWMWSSRPSPKKLTPLVDPESQTRELPVSFCSNGWEMKRFKNQDGSRVCKYLKSDSLMRFIHHDAATLYQAIRRGERMSKDGPMLGYRCKKLANEPYLWLHYNEVINRASCIGRAMRAVGIPVGQEGFVGIFAKNRPEWVLVEQATYSFKNIIGEFEKLRIRLIRRILQFHSMRHWERTPLFISSTRHKLSWW